jgi:hypothetical protein
MFLLRGRHQDDGGALRSRQSENLREIAIESYDHTGFTGGTSEDFGVCRLLHPEFPGV